MTVDTEDNIRPEIQEYLNSYLGFFNDLLYTVFMSWFSELENEDAIIASLPHTNIKINLLLCGDFTCFNNFKIVKLKVAIVQNCDALIIVFHVCKVPFLVTLFFTIV